MDGEKYGGETILRPLFRKSKLRRSLDQQSVVSYRLFLLYVKVEDYQNVLKLKVLTTCF